MGSSQRAPDGPDNRTVELQTTDLTLLGGEQTAIVTRIAEPTVMVERLPPIRPRPRNPRRGGAWLVVVVYVVATVALGLAIYERFVMTRGGSP